MTKDQKAARLFAFFESYSTRFVEIAHGSAQSAPPREAAKKKASKSPSDQVLGGRMLWNVMHLLRGDELDDVARREAMNQLAFAAALILVLSGILVGVLVWM